uniref:Uncharacterized protein n=1 Tax=Alexandrium andersonii TaxID=327968 RepID=A0A7S2I0G9_9DINO
MYSSVGLSDGEAKPGTFTNQLAAMVSPSKGKDGKGWYMVMRPAIVRKGESLDTAKKGVVQAGEHVLVSLIKGRRAQVQAPYKGWVSVKTAAGAPIITKADLMMGGAMSMMPGIANAAGGAKDKATATKMAENWKKMSASELHHAMSKGKVDPDVVLGEGMDKIQGFLNDANKQLAAATGDKHGGTVAPMPAGLKDGTQPMPQFHLPSMDKVKTMMNARMPESQRQQQAQMDSPLLSQNALAVAQQMLKKQGTTLQEATKSLTGVDHALLEKNVKDAEERIANARAESQ